MTHNTKHLSPLRQRMTEDMSLRNLSPQTQTAYIRAVKNLTCFLGQSPDAASAEDMRRYQLHLVEQGVAYGAGLRANEVVHLSVGDIDSEHMVIRVEQGKGKRDRYAMLSPALLDILRA